MKLRLIVYLFIISFAVKAQETPVKWATQETFFEDLVGKNLPDFRGITIKNKAFSIANLKGQIVVINFWFEKCPPCIAEMPELNQIVEKYAAKGVRFIGLTYDRPIAAKSFQKRNGYKYEIVSLTPDEIRKLNINHGFPTNILAGKDGKIIFATANISFSNEMPEFKAKSIRFEEKLKSELHKNSN